MSSLVKAVIVQSWNGLAQNNPRCLSIELVSNLSRAFCCNYAHAYSHTKSLFDSMNEMNE